MNKKVVPNPDQKGWEADGTTPDGTPVYKWESGGGSGGGSIQDGDTEGQITTWDGTEWTPEGAVVVDSSGNVGIGTVPASAWSSSNYKALEINNVTIASSASTSAFSHNVYNDGYSWRYIEDGFASQYYQSAGKHVWLYKASGKAGDSLVLDEAMRIDSSGDATFNGTVIAGDIEGIRFYRKATGGLTIGSGALIPINQDGVAENDLISLGSLTYKWKQVHSVTTRSSSFIQDGSPVIDAKGLITTLSTLRKATMDETTLEGMRDALADAIGGLIENLEHEIATMPAEDSE